MTLTDVAAVTDSDREALRQAVADLAAARSGETAIRAAIETPAGYDAVLYAQLCELGLPGLLAPEDLGGSGSSFVELAVVLEELGRALVPSPLISVSLAVAALAAGEDTGAARRWIPRLVEGDLLAALAVPQPAGGALPLPDVLAVRVGDGAVSLAGYVPVVADAHLDGLLLVTARDPSPAGPDDVALFAVDAAATGVTRLPLGSTDLTRRFARVELVGATAVRVGGPGAVEHLYAAAAAAYAAEQVGGAAAVLAGAVGYATIREQFGRPIGSFQSIKHHCAEMLQALESARATSRRAAAAIATDDPETGVLVSIAKAWCSDAYAGGAATNLHIHGGIGFTWEHSAHLHLRRALLDAQLFGDARHHRLVLADLLGL